MCSRSVEEMTGIFQSAKLSLDQLLPLSQEITFDSEFSGTDLRLLELETEIGDSIRVGDRLVIRGDDSDSAVLCTRTSSYELKNVETSNSLLILKQLTFPEDALDKLNELSGEIGADEAMEEAEATPANEQITNGGRNQFIGKRSILHVATSYYELTKIKPILSRIQRILAPTAYNGPMEEEHEVEDGNESGQDFITFQKLLDQVPGSEREIEDYIARNLRTFEMNGNVRLMGDDYLFRALSQVLDSIESNSWKFGGINKEIVIKELSGLVPDFVLQKVFDWFFSPQTVDSPNAASDSGAGDPGKDAGEGRVLYTMKNEEMSRFLGMMILKAGGRFTLADFLLAWGESVPEGLEVSLKHLEGLAVTEAPDGSPPVIFYFPANSLPETIPERFQALFQAKSKWRQEEMLPFLQDVSTTAQNASLLLTKHARVYTVAGVKYCCSKHGK